MEWVTAAAVAESVQPNSESGCHEQCVCVIERKSNKTRCVEFLLSFSEGHNSTLFYIGTQQNVPLMIN